MLKADQLRDLIIVPALTDLVMHSKEAVDLLIFTAAVESDGGTYLKQIGGPALGIYQMELANYNDIWQNFIVYKQSIGLLMGHHFNAFRMPEEDRLIYDLRFATAMCRIHYARVQSPLPQEGDLEAIWDYYKKYYNTSQGAADKEGALARYKAFIT